jgi:hypothetical protein
MRIAVGGSFVLAFSLAASAGAQPSDPPLSVESLQVALQKSQQPSILIPAVPPWVAPAATRLGILTFVPPDMNGQMVKVVFPVGELTSRAAHALSTARRRRAERKAHDEILHELREFLAQGPMR